MQETANERPIPTGEGLTFEKVWAMFQETDRKQREDWERWKQEWERRKEEWKRRKEESDREWKEIKEQMKETKQIVGDLGNRFGELAEHLVAPGIAQRFNELGYHFSGVAPGGYFIKDRETGKDLAQVDILLENGECIMAVEVKSRPRKQDIEHHVKRMEILRKYWKPQDPRKIHGAIAGAVFGIEEKQAAIESGFYVIEQSGDTMKIDVPGGFVPGEW